MTIHTIKLPTGEWTYDDSAHLGSPGGFGEVFRGKGENGEVAIKRLRLTATQAAHRELNIGQNLMRRDLKYVVPILDAGQDANSDRYFLVMPVCNRSLQDTINQTKDKIDTQTAIAAIAAMISGLCEVGDIVHRDLKPGNILLHNGQWKIADFGIAKFIEDSTSQETLRGSLTPLYAAPEQWLGERPTSATDIYALGCIMHTLFNGRPPFQGTHHDIREHHLHTPPPQIDALPPRLSAFVSLMLRKPQAARPTLTRCAHVLNNISLNDNEANYSISALEKAAKQVAARDAEEEAQRQTQEVLRKKRFDLSISANAELLELANRLFATIENASDSVSRTVNRLNFGEAILRLQGPEILDEYAARKHAGGKAPYSYTKWDVLSWAIISITCQKTKYMWAASLLFCDKKDGEGYRWNEAGFYDLSYSRSAPFGLPGHDIDVDLALSRKITHSVNPAYGPLPIDGESETDFTNRWLNLTAKAAIGELRQPQTLPISNLEKVLK